MNKEFLSSNDLRMMPTSKLNWRIESTYRDNTGPDYYLISVGTIGDMHICLFEKGILSITHLSYSSDFVLKFKVDDLEAANVIVLAFAEGMNHSFKDTIYEL